MTDGLAGKRILIVEDEFLIAFDLAGALNSLGAHVIGPVADLAGGLELVGSERVDAALLDINLGGTPSYPIAERLTAQCVPYIFLSGYDELSTLPAYRATPKIMKPFANATIARMLELMLRRQEEDAVGAGAG